MTKTPTGVIIHWPDSDISSLLEEEDSPRMVSAILEELPQHPFQQGRELTSPGPELSETGSCDPERQIYAGSGGSRSTPPQAHNLEAEFCKNGGIFDSPTANIISARHILETLQLSPPRHKAKEILAATAVQVDQIAPLASISREPSRVHNRGNPSRITQNRSAYGSSDNRRHHRDNREVNSRNRGPSVDLRDRLPPRDARSRIIVIREERDAWYDGIIAYSDDIR